MIQIIQDGLKFINEISGGNENMAAAITLAVSGAIGWFINVVPGILMRYAERKLLLTITVDNLGNYSDYRLLDKWMSVIKFTCNSFMFQNKWDDINKKETASFKPGYLKQFIFHKGIPMIISREKLPTNNPDAENITPSEITITTLVFFRFILDRIKKDVNAIIDEDEFLLPIFQLDAGGVLWDIIATEQIKTLDSLSISENNKASYRKIFNQFIENKDDLHSLGLDHKLSIMLTGIPGTGKSALTKALACEFDLSIYSMNIDNINSTTIGTAIRNISKPAILLLEDIDSNDAFLDRSVFLEKNKNKDKDSTLGISTVLNILDGVISLDGLVVIMTTNHLSKIDPAIYRKSRVQQIIEVPIPSAETVRDYFEKLYPTLISQRDNIKYVPLTGSEINDIVRTSILDTESVIKMLNEYSEKKNHTLKVA